MTDRYKLVCADSREALRRYASDVFDSVVTDPPYELGFMGNDWDKKGVAFDAGFWHQVIRTCKPGAHLVAFGATRTYHRMVCAIEDAGWEVRDCVMWVSSTKFPKSKGLLKPACEPIVLARRPLAEKTVEENVAKYGTGALNIDACRLRYRSESDLEKTKAKNPGRTDVVTSNVYGKDRPQQTVNAKGRWPSNFVLSHDADCTLEICVPECVCVKLDTQSGYSYSRIGKPRGSRRPGKGWGMTKTGAEYDDEGGASRFFYCARASASDRGEKNDHPTVKPTEVMRYLCRLVTPPGGVILDPFAGSGSTGKAALIEGYRFVGIEIDERYVKIAKKRLEDIAK